jgi:hypothetical protein
VRRARHPFQRIAHHVLQAMIHPHIAVMVDAAMAADGEETGMLAGAIVMQRRRRGAGARQFDRHLLAARPMRAAFERPSVQSGPLQHGTRQRHMRRFARMGGAGERQFLFAEAECIGRTALHQRQRLDRLHRRAREDRPVDIAERGMHLAVGIEDGDGSAMPALHPAAARHLDQNRIVHARPRNAR